MKMETIKVLNASSLLIRLAAGLIPSLVFIVVYILSQTIC